MKLKMKETLAKVTSTMRTAFATKQVQSDTKTVTANGTQTWTLDFSKPGYTPIGIIHLQNNVGSAVIINGHWWSGSTLNVYCRSIYSGSTSVFIIATVVYARTELVGGYCVTQLFQGLQRFSHRSCLGVM